MWWVPDRWKKIGEIKFSLRERWVSGSLEAKNDQINEVLIVTGALEGMATNFGEGIMPLGKGDKFRA